MQGQRFHIRQPGGLLSFFQLLPIGSHRCQLLFILIQLLPGCIQSRKAAGCLPSLPFLLLGCRQCLLLLPGPLPGRRQLFPQLRQSLLE